MKTDHLIKKGVIEWLLGHDYPSIRYLTFTKLLGLNENTKAVVETKSSIMQTGNVPEILAGQKTGGFWGNPVVQGGSPARFTNTAQRLHFLAELCADGNDQRIVKARDFVIRSLYNKNKRLFGIFTGRHYEGTQYKGLETDPPDGFGEPQNCYPCHSAEFTRAMIKLGYFENKTVQDALSWLVKYQRFEDGIPDDTYGEPHHPLYGRDSLHGCFGNHACVAGVYQVLSLLSVIPKQYRDKSIVETTKRAVNWALIHHIIRQSHDTTKGMLPPKKAKNYYKLGSLVDSSFLYVLVALSDLGCKDKRMETAIDILMKKQSKDGTWIYEGNSFSKSTKLPFKDEEIGKPGKWATLKCLLVLKAFFDLKMPAFSRF